MAIRNTKVARLTAVGTVVQPILAEPNTKITLAHIAIFVARAGALGLVTLHAHDVFALHGVLCANYIPRATRRQAASWRRSNCFEDVRFLDTPWGACYFRVLASDAEILL